jgi:hypothetical protein
MDVNELEESFIGDGDFDYETQEMYGTHGRNPSQTISGIATSTSRPTLPNPIHSNCVVDLSLASSYLPGIYAMLKVLVLLSALNIMQKVGMHMDQAIIVCAACLYIDRCTSLYYILDTGACALCVLISVCVNASRIGISGEPGIVNMSLSFAWVLVSTIILCDSHRPLMRNIQIPGIIHFITSSFCAVHGFLCLDSEVDVIAYMRAVVFTILTILWIYTLDLRQRRDMCNDSFSGCVDRFAVVLVADVYVSGVYAILACIVIAWRHQRSGILVHAPIAEVVCESPPTAWPSDRREGVATVWPNERRGVSSIPPMIETDPMEMDVHVAFRLAQANARKGVHAR